MLAINIQMFLKNSFGFFVCFFTFPVLTWFFFFILGSIFGAENASHVSMYARLSLFTGFIQPICLFSPKVITLELKF